MAEPAGYRCRGCGAVAVGATGCRCRHTLEALHGADEAFDRAEQAEAELLECRVARAQRDELAEVLREIAEHACRTCDLDLDGLGDGACAGCVAAAALAKLDHSEGSDG